MLMCFVNWSSVINLDLFWEQAFYYTLKFRIVALAHAFHHKNIRPAGNTQWHNSALCQIAMFVEMNVCYSALFTNLVGLHIGAICFPLSDVILAREY